MQRSTQLLGAHWQMASRSLTLQLALQQRARRAHTHSMECVATLPPLQTPLRMPLSLAMWAHRRPGSVALTVSMKVDGSGQIRARLNTTRSSPANPLLTLVASTSQVLRTLEPKALEPPAFQSAVLTSTGITTSLITSMGMRIRCKFSVAREESGTISMKLAELHNFMLLNMAEMVRPCFIYLPAARST